MTATAARRGSAPPYLRVVDDTQASAAPWLSVIIPACNAAPHLPGTVQRLLGHLRSQPVSFEVVVVGSSRDDTVQIIGALEESAPEVRAVSLPRHRGKGAAVNAGYRVSRGERIIVMDADGTVELEAIARFLEALEGSDVAIASPSHVPAQPLHRRLMGLAMQQLVKRATGVGLLDMQCGFLGFTRPAAALLFHQQRIQRRAFDVELCYLALRHHLTVVELPVTCRHGARCGIGPWWMVWAKARSAGGGAIRLLDPLTTIVDVLRIRLNDLRGLYR